jgi:hypothetical protein
MIAAIVCERHRSANNVALTYKEIYLTWSKGDQIPEYPANSLCMDIEQFLGDLQSV